MIHNREIVMYLMVMSYITVSFSFFEINIFSLSTELALLFSIKIPVWSPGKFKEKAVKTNITIPLKFNPDLLK